MCMVDVEGTMSLIRYAVDMVQSLYVMRCLIGNQYICMRRCCDVKTGQQHSVHTEQLCSLAGGED
jgi:hypothetical protein